MSFILHISKWTHLHSYCHDVHVLNLSVSRTMVRSICRSFELFFRNRSTHNWCCACTVYTVNSTAAATRVITPRLFLRVWLSAWQLSCRRGSHLQRWFTVVRSLDLDLRLYSICIISSSNRKKTVQIYDIVFAYHRPLRIAAYADSITGARKYLRFLFRSPDMIRVHSTRVIISACLFMLREEALL